MNSKADHRVCYLCPGRPDGLRTEARWPGHGILRQVIVSSDLKKRLRFEGKAAAMQASMESDLLKAFGQETALDEKSLSFLVSAMRQHQREGFEYLSFKAALSRLVASGITQDVAVRTAFITASTVGLSKEKLLETARHYRTILEGEEDRFQAALRQQLDTRIAAKRRQLDERNAELAAWRAEMAKLEEKIGKAEAEVAETAAHIEQEMDKIRQTREQFLHTLESVCRQIEADLSRFGEIL